MKGNIKLILMQTPNPVTPPANNALPPLPPLEPTQTVAPPPGPVTTPIEPEPAQQGKSGGSVWTLVIVLLFVILVAAVGFIVLNIGTIQQSIYPTYTPTPTIPPTTTIVPSVSPSTTPSGTTTVTPSGSLTVTPSGTPSVTPTLTSTPPQG
jgi:hypothetical protein